VKASKNLTKKNQELSKDNRSAYIHRSQGREVSLLIEVVEKEYLLPGMESKGKTRSIKSGGSSANKGILKMSKETTNNPPPNIRKVQSRKDIAEPPSLKAPVSQG